MAKDPEAYAHQEWLGYVQPVGLVVSIPALLSAQAQVNRNIAPDHQRLLACLPEQRPGQIVPEIPDLPAFTHDVLGWTVDDLVPWSASEPTHLALEVALPEYNERLQPTHVVPEFKPADPERPWLMLVQVLAPGTSLDEEAEESERRWHASPQARFERLLRETDVSTGLLFNGTEIRLVYAPRGETSGYMTFNVGEMATVAGRPIFAALHMLLCSERVFGIGMADPEKQSLNGILADSRKYQNVVSTKLAEQVLAALYELLRGFQAANDQRRGELLREVLTKDPDHVYAGLLTVLMRLVFLLYAEDRSLLSSDAVYTNHYSVTGLFERLRADEGRNPDTMNQRYGAWAQLLTLFRLIYDGGRHGDFHIRRRRGYLFDPDRYNFLEGRAWKTPRDEDDGSTIPQVSDGVIFRVLRNLLILDGERLSYRTLDVEQIGSVYETIMGFHLEVADGRSIAVKPVKSHGAPTTINLEALLAESPSKRAKWLKDHAEQKITGQAATALKQAETIEDLLAALDRKLARHATPNVAPKGAMIFQPSDERRRTGAHYTPRSLTEPIVRTTLEPILNRLTANTSTQRKQVNSLTGNTSTQREQVHSDGDSECEEIHSLARRARIEDAELPTVYEPTREDKRRYTKAELAARIRLSEKAVEVAKRAREVGTPHPSQILDLKICDPAMGSGAFLVETCRQLGDELVKAWYAHDCVPSDIPADEDELLYARRLVAQRCLYGVDKNAMAVDLAKLSLWLATLAKDHPFTFLDHSLRHGDSLVGLTRRQIIGFHWEPKKQKQFSEDLIQKRLDRATEARAKILGAREDVPYRDQEQRLAVADEALDMIRMIADACVSAFFTGKKKRDREEEADRLFGIVSDYVSSLATSNQQLATSFRSNLAAAAASLRSGEHPLPPFHWEIEFPEVFSRENGGFDGFIGNPPFLGGKRISTNFGDGYRDWLAAQHDESNSNADLVSHFFRRAFDLNHEKGTLGLIATNTISQGDTRSSGLRWICNHGGVIYSARRRYKWPGEAAVQVSVIHIAKGIAPQIRELDDRKVEKITAYLFHAGSNDNPATLGGNHSLSFHGSIILGSGFLFDDSTSKSDVTPLSVMEQLVTHDPRNANRIFPYIGGEEVNSSPSLKNHRFVIDFGSLSEEEAAEWPDLLSIVREKVKPNRDGLKRKVYRERWWQHGEKQTALYDGVHGHDRVLVNSQVSSHLSFAYLPANWVYAYTLNIFLLPTLSAFAVLQSRPHEVWTRFFASSLEDRLRYTPTDCFDTFAFPVSFETKESLEIIGNEYYDHRSKTMMKNNEGLTKTYNRFHDPHERSPAILHLRELHAAMDRAVLEAYGWDDLAQTARCEFLLDYEEEGEGEVASGQLLVASSSLATSNQQLATGTRRRRLPWRLRWPDDFRDEVLARLLELNEKRAEEERLAGVAGANK